ncbi:NAD(P)-binding protein [Pedobacter sp. WC2501]|uniref:NAD(P)-binding protein n=1 Tax=Pedobacter sp. WC2501 TaxID=3461400 RepID=UPI0040451EEA
MEKKYFEELKKEILEKSGIKEDIPNKFKILSNEIYRLTNRKIGEKTLTRFFGIDRGRGFAANTEFALLEYVGRKDWSSYESPLDVALPAATVPDPTFLDLVSQKESKDLNDKEYLELFKIEDRQYIIGIYQGGITVYKQQIRALNIFNALISSKQIRLDEDGFTIGIVGGGVAGLTFAAAALKSNLVVRLFEKEPHYLHMQSGCDTRKIHPNMYEWPDTGSLFPYAKLPVLSWQYDTASNVSKQIIKNFKKIKEEHSINYGEYMRTKPVKVEKNENKSQKKIKITLEQVGGDKRTVPVFCDLLIYAVGYGIEGGVNPASHTFSYWRNDSIGQSNLRNGNNHYMISGLGDGGLIDLFRLKIYDFSYEYILTVFKSNPTAFKNLKKKLSAVKKAALEHKEIPDGFLVYQFSLIVKNDYAYILKALKDADRIRENIHVTLNGSEPTFLASLDFKKISLLNAFLAYILEEDHFKYEGGRIVMKIAEKRYYFNDNLLEKENLIVRHGTLKSAIINGLPFSEQQKNRLKLLETAQIKILPYGIVQPRWTIAEINNHFTYAQRTLAEDEQGPQKQKRVEYLTPQTLSVCTSFVSVLNSVLEKFKASGQDYRTSIYRVTDVQGDLFFQQITSFFGTRSMSGDGSAKRVYKLDRGNIGYSFTTGKPLLIVRNDEKAFEEIVALLNLKSYYNEIKDPKSFLTIPIVSDFSFVDAEGVHHTGTSTNAVLYIDSTDEHFFDAADVKEAILSVAKGFVKSIEHMLKHEQLFMADLEYHPIVLNGDKYSDKLYNNKCYIDLVNTGLGSGLKFSEYHSFDIMHNSPERFV